METDKPNFSNPMAGGIPPSTVKIPTVQELYDFFNQFLLMLLRLPSQKIDKVEDDIHMLPNERGLMFVEPITGILVLRTSEDFAKGLAKLAGTQEKHSDLFVE